MYQARIWPRLSYMCHIRSTAVSRGRHGGPPREVISPLLLSLFPSLSLSLSLSCSLALALSLALSLSLSLSLFLSPSLPLSMRAPSGDGATHRDDQEPLRLSLRGARGHPTPPDTGSGCVRDRVCVREVTHGCSVLCSACRVSCLVFGVSCFAFCALCFVFRVSCFLSRVSG